MSAAPIWKVYTADGTYVASVKEPEAGAALMRLYGDGSTIRDGHAKKCTVWTEGVDGFACDSFDVVADTCLRRAQEFSARTQLREVKP